MASAIGEGKIQLSRSPTCRDLLKLQGKENINDQSNRVEELPCMFKFDEEKPLPGCINARGWDWMQE